MTGGPRSSASAAGRAEQRWPWAGLGRKATGLHRAGKAGRGYDGCWAGICWVGLQRGVERLRWPAGLEGWRAELERGRGKGFKVWELRFRQRLQTNRIQI
jgi:hypothetical protein